MFGIDDKDLLNKDKIKILNGIAGSGKSTETVDTLRKLGSNFCLASFSNALKFAAQDKFNCAVDTICGLAFVNTPFPRSDEKDVTEFDTVILDEILLDGVECIKWMEHHVGTVNIIALTDSRQMLNASNGRASIRAFEELCKKDYTVVIDIDKTRRARNKETEKMYERLYKLDSNKIMSLDEVQKIFKCDIVHMEDIEYSDNASFLCHSNAAEHEVYKMYGLCDRKDIKLIPKNHISRNREVDVSKYPICDQITAEAKRVNSYLQAHNVGSVTRYQGREVVTGDACYFVCKKDDIFTGREIYTVGTRCQDMKSLHIAIINIPEYKDPETINGRGVCEAIVLDIPNHDKSYQYVSQHKMYGLIKQFGDENTTYRTEMITSGNNIIYSTLRNVDLEKFADIGEDEVVIKKGSYTNKKSFNSIMKKDSSMHFDFMPRVYQILGREVYSARIQNPKRSSKDKFTRSCDLSSAFPTLLTFAELPKAGCLYEKYDKDLLNFYVYKGDKVSPGAIITEALANKLGDSEYVFSTAKQIGCDLGRYTYEQAHISSDRKKAINKNFKWGKLESNYYDPEIVVDKGEVCKKYVKCKTKVYELVSCALWSALCLIMLEAIESLGVSEAYVATDCIYYNSKKDPVLPSWCDYRIEDVAAAETKDDGGKYHNIIKQSYEDLPTEAEVKRAKARERKRKQRERERAIKEGRSEI